VSPASFSRITFAMILAVATVAARGQEPERSLADMSIEDLMNESVTSVGKKESRLGDAPAAVSVITREDIRRSGYTSIPELLRLVPGVQVARIDGNEWAISARGFNSQYANKLLVLIDGRTVYTPSSAGVYWNAQDTLLEDVDRIEVIRGPGATLWGANAVDGVINIITRNARDTQGLLLSTSTGSEDAAVVGARYGGQIGSDVHYRAYVKYQDRQSLVYADGQDAPDGERGTRGGFRADWQGPSDSATLQADGYDTDTHKPVTLTSLQPPYSVDEALGADNHGASAAGGWTHSFADHSQLNVQAYWQHLEQNYGFGVESQDSYNIDVQHHLSLGTRNDVVWGLGYRYTKIEETPTSTLVWTPETSHLPLYQTFVQDEISLIPERWRLVLGTKLEHNSLTGLETEPSARLIWTTGATGTIWAGVSRATRTPALFERDSDLNVAAFQAPGSPPVWVKLLGNSHVDAEKLLAYELGYRIQPLDSLSIDVSAFYNVYHDLIDYTANAPVFQFDPAPPHILISSTENNADNAQTYGVEVSAQWRVQANWRLVASYSGLRMHVRPDATLEGSSPCNQAQLRSYWDLPGHFEINAAAMYVDAISFVPTTTRVHIPSYVRADLGVSWHPSDAWQVGIWGENLLDARHVEFASVQTPLQVEIPRSVLARAVWQF
jgi:iron complex outermembrane recepter protein